MKIEEKIIETLIKTTYTRSGFYYRLELFKEFLETIFFVNDSTGQKTIEQFLEARGENADTISGMLPLQKHLNEEITPQTMYSTLEKTKKLVESMAVLSLYIPVVFPRGEIDRLGVWFRKNVNDKILIAPKIDPLTAGGCAFVFESVYHDFSIKYFMKKQRNDIDALLQNMYDKKSKATT